MAVRAAALCGRVESPGRSAPAAAFRLRRLFLRDRHVFLPSICKKPGYEPPSMRSKRLRSFACGHASTFKLAPHSGQSPWQSSRTGAQVADRGYTRRATSPRSISSLRIGYVVVVRRPRRKAHGSASRGRPRRPRGSGGTRRPSAPAPSRDDDASVRGFEEQVDRDRRAVFDPRAAHGIAIGGEHRLDGQARPGDLAQRRHRGNEPTGKTRRAHLRGLVKDDPDRKSPPPLRPRSLRAPRLVRPR